MSLSPFGLDRKLARKALSQATRDRWADRIGKRADKWTPAEDALALDMKARGKSYGQIAMKVKRTPDAVAARLRVLVGLRSP